MYARRTFFRVSVFLWLFLSGLVYLGSRANSAEPDLCIGGHTYGTWNLPLGSGETGDASGVLVVDRFRNPLYRMDAILSEGPPPMEFRFGEIDGILTDSSGEPAYSVEGTWRTAPRDDSHGEWQATISSLDTGEPVGSIDAEFTRGPGREGTYAGQWRICERP